MRVLLTEWSRKRDPRVFLIEFHALAFVHPRRRREEAGRGLMCRRRRMIFSPRGCRGSPRARPRHGTMAARYIAENARSRRPAAATFASLMESDLWQEDGRLSAARGLTASSCRARSGRGRAQASDRLHLEEEKAGVPAAKRASCWSRRRRSHCCSSRHTRRRARGSLA